jgi:hypothetical protein
MFESNNYNKNNSKKPLDRLGSDIDRFEQLYPSVTRGEGEGIQETDAQIEARFAKLREARAKAVNAFGEKTYEDVWDNITQEEIDYYAKQRAEEPPAQKFAREKAEWFFHDSSCYMRDLEQYDGVGCYNGICVPQCDYYIAAIDEEPRTKLRKEIEHNNNNSAKHRCTNFRRSDTKLYTSAI